MTSAKTKWIRPILHPLLPVFRELMVISFFVNGLAMVVPIFVLQVYDRVVYHAGMSTLQGLVIGVVILLVFDFMLRKSRSKLMQSVALRIDVEVGTRLFDKLMALPLRSLESRPANFWQMLFRDVDMVRNTLSGATAILMADLPFVIMFLGLIFIIAQPIAWVLLVMFSLFLIVAWRSGKVLGDMATTERNVQNDRDTLVAEIISGRGTVKALALERAMKPMWESRQAGTIEQALQRGTISDGYVAVGQSLTMATSVGMTSIGALFIIEQQLTMGALVAANMLIGRLLGPVNQLVGAWRGFTAFRQSLDRLGDIFDEEEERTQSVLTHQRPKGRITLDGVSFRYEDDAAPAVEAVRLALPAGSMSAIVGKNGSGKSTLLKIMMNLYKPYEGRILIDDADITQFTRSEIAGWMGFVPQECVLFNGTIRDNIAFSRPSATDEDILKAATMAGVHQYIVDLPDGYATKVGEAGSRLSAGQRQRIAVARALVGDPPVLMLDEPSASLDRQAEEDLRNTLAALAKDHTIVVVTHSPVLLPACQQVIVLDKGKLMAAGPTAEVMRWLSGQRTAEQPKTPAPASAPALAPALAAAKPPTAKPAAKAPPVKAPT